MSQIKLEGLTESQLEKLKSEADAQLEKLKTNKKQIELKNLESLLIAAFDKYKKLQGDQKIKFTATVEVDFESNVCVETPYNLAHYITYQNYDDLFDYNLSARITKCDLNKEQKELLENRVDLVFNSACEEVQKLLSDAHRAGVEEFLDNCSEISSFMNELEYHFDVRELNLDLPKKVTKKKSK